jgi:hypothetical protein
LPDSCSGASKSGTSRSMPKKNRGEGEREKTTSFNNNKKKLSDLLSCFRHTKKEPAQKQQHQPRRRERQRPEDLGAKNPGWIPKNRKIRCQKPQQNPATETETPEGLRGRISNGWTLRWEINARFRNHNKSARQQQESSKPLKENEEN